MQVMASLLHQAPSASAKAVSSCFTDAACLFATCLEEHCVWEQLADKQDNTIISTVVDQYQQWC